MGEDEGQSAADVQPDGAGVGAACEAQPAQLPGEGH